MTQLPVETIDPIVQRLHTLAQDLPDLKDAAQIYEIILPLLRDADLCVTPIALTADQARRKLEMGLPLLHDLNLELDAKAACNLMLRLACALETTIEESRPPQLAMAARWIQLALEDNDLDFSVLVPHVATGDKEFVITLAQSLQLNSDLLWTLAQNTLKPALRAWHRQLTTLVEGIPWHKGYCFVCGAGATLGELQENNQVKHLRCGQCGADWQFPRLQCMYCGNQDHNTLSYLYAESRPDKTRVEVCNRCHGYLKVIAAFSPTQPELLAVEDLATLHFDYIAQERGYARVAFQ